MKRNIGSLVLSLVWAVPFLLTGAQALAEDASANKGVGPVKEVKLEAIDAKLADKGKKTFETKCSACHKLEERYVGPALKDVTKRRSPEWIMNMILNPAEMLQKDPVAQELLGEYLTQMTFQDVSQDDVRAILEYFRQVDSGAAPKAESAKVKAGKKK